MDRVFGRDDGRGNRGTDMVNHMADHDPTPRGPDGGFTVEQLWRFMYDIRLEPDWRRNAGIENAFYDGDQLTSATLEKMRANGIPPIIVNMIAPAIDSVAGWEVIARADLMAVPEDDASYDVAMAMNVKLKEAQRLTQLGRRVGNQFRQSIKSGIGWLEVSRNPDPFQYPYRVINVPWREMYFDYRSREPDLSDSRFIVRRQWYDFDELVRYFPRHRRLIMNSAKGWPTGWLNEWEDFNGGLGEDLRSGFDQEQRFTLEDDEWRSQLRGRIALYEILYYVPETVDVLKMRDGRVVTLDRKSPLHLEALRRNMATHQRGVTRSWRQAYFAGPHHLADRRLAANRPHYVPMVSYRKDSDGSVYGLIRRMLSPQEAVNARYSRILNDLSSRKYLVDDDAVDDHRLAADELNKSNAYVMLKGERTGDEGIRQMPSMDTTPATFQLLQEAKMNIFDVTGLHPEFYGRLQSAGQSGRAIDSIIEQITQVLGIVVDNYRTAKHRAGELLMHLMTSDIAMMDDLEVETDEKADGKRRKILINTRQSDGTRNNDVLMMRIRVALADTPASVTYQQQKFQSLVEIIKSMPPEMQAVMMDLVVRAAALPDGEEMLERIRSMTGYGPEPRDPQKRQELQQRQQQQQQIQQAMQELEMRLQAAELAAKEAKAAHDMARAEKTAESDTDLTDAKTMNELAKADVVDDEQRRKERETEAKMVEASARLKAERNADRETARKSKDA